jgi:S1-C subfamily serine protease
VLGVIVGVVLGVPTRTTPASLDFAPVSLQAAAGILGRSTVEVLAFGCNLQRRDGSAVMVGPGMMLTNEHVITGSRLIDLVAHGYPTTASAAWSVATAGDVGTVSAPLTDLPSIPLAPSDPTVGSSVLLGGYPHGLVGQPDPGLVIDQMSVVGFLPGADIGEPWPVMRLSGSARVGMSGGPVLDSAGHLAGIVFGDEVPTGNALVIPASALRSLLRANAFVPSSC